MKIDDLHDRREEMRTLMIAAVALLLALGGVAYAGQCGVGAGPGTGGGGGTGAGTGGSAGGGGAGITPRKGKHCMPRGQC